MCNPDMPGKIEEVGDVECEVPSEVADASRRVMPLEQSATTNVVELVHQFGHYGLTIQC